MHVRLFPVTRRLQAARTRPAASGQTLVEFALVLPVLILLILAVIDFGRAAVDYNALAHAAREGAQQVRRPLVPLPHLRPQEVQQQIGRQRFHQRRLAGWRGPSSNTDFCRSSA